MTDIVVRNVEEDVARTTLIREDRDTDEPYRRRCGT
jgi:hypothetical protein